jgi:hypothetical protein
MVGPPGQTRRQEDVRRAPKNEKAQGLLTTRGLPAFSGLFVVYQPFAESFTTMVGRSLRVSQKRFRSK